MLTKTLVGVVLVLVVSAPAAFARNWTDSTGTHTIEAEFVEIVNTHDSPAGQNPTVGNEKRLLSVRLKKQDGQEITVPLARLSDADQHFIESHYLAPKDKEHSSPPKEQGALGRTPLSEAAVKQLDDAIVEAVIAANPPKVITTSTAFRSEDAYGRVTTSQGKSVQRLAQLSKSATLRAGEQETLEIVIAGTNCKVSHNWKWRLTYKKQQDQFTAACTRPSGNIRLTALSDLPFDGVTVPAGAILIRNGAAWELQEGQKGLEHADAARAASKRSKGGSETAAADKLASDGGLPEAKQPGRSKPAVEIPDAIARIDVPSGKEYAIDFSDATIAKNGRISVEVTYSSASEGRNKASFDAAAVFWVTKNADLRVAQAGKGVDFSSPAGIVAFWAQSSRITNSPISFVGYNSRHQITGGTTKFDLARSPDGRKLKASGSVRSPLEELAPQAIGFVLVKGSSAVSNFIWIPLQ